MRRFAFDFDIADWRHLRLVRNGPLGCACWTFLLGPLWITWFREDGHTL